MHYLMNAKNIILVSRRIMQNMKIMMMDMKQVLVMY